MKAENLRNAGETSTDETLWMILAIIQPFKLDAVTLALEAIPGFGGMTVSECRGFGAEKMINEGAGSREQNRELVDFTTKVRVECAVPGAHQADAVIEAIVRVAHTGNRGDGKLFAWPISHAVRLRTSETGAKAL